MEQGKTTRTLSEIEADIAQTRSELENVHGTETEVYARIVGYYRAVRNWNKGKADEFKHRKMFNIDDSKEYKISEADKSCSCTQPEVISKISEASVSGASQQPSSYEFFARKTCPNCPPVKAYMADVNIAGKIIDVDTSTGLSEAAAKGVFAAPTVIVYDESGAEIARGHNVEELTAIFEKEAVAV